MTRGRWKDPLDAFKGQGPKPGSYQAELDRIQRATARPVVPQANPGEKTDTGYVLPFDVHVNAGVGQEVILTKSDTVLYDTLYCELSTAEINNGFSVTEFQAIADGAVVGFIRMGCAITIPGTREWKIRNTNAGTAGDFTGYLLNGGARHEMVRPISSGLDNNNQIRHLKLTSFNELLVTSPPDAIENSDLYQISENSFRAFGIATGLGANPVNQVLHAGAASRKHIVTDIFLMAFGNAMVGDLITATFNFSTVGDFFALAIDTTPGTGTPFASHHFGDTGPSGTAPGSVRFTLLHQLGTVDGWKLGCNVRYFV